MQPIFISYASRDQADANRIVHALEARGLKCWMSSRDIPFGQDYQAHIVTAIEACRVMLVLLSRHSAASKEVPKETALASELNREMIPVRIDASELTGALRYQATNAQRLDLSAEFDARIDELARQLARVLDTAESVERQLARLAMRRRLAHILVWPVAAAVIAVAVFEVWQFAPPPQWFKERFAQAAWQNHMQAQPAQAPVQVAPRPPPPDARARAADIAQRYYAALSGADTDMASAMQQLISDPIQFYGRPMSRRDLMAQQVGYRLRWPDRSFIVRPETLQETCTNSATCAVTGVLDYTLQNAARGLSLSGSQRFDMRVVLAGPGRLTSITAVALQKHQPSP